METEKQFKVLVVDDNLKNIQVIGNILKENNYSVGYATDGKQALEILAKKNDFDLVLLDIDMPVMNGFDTCKALRADAKLSEIPVIFLTAFADEDMIVEGFDAGAQDYITKPFSSRELLSRVKTHLMLKYNADKVKWLNQVLEQKVELRTKELSEAYAKLEKALEQLEVLDNAKTEFLQIISHEIRTPLNGIIGFLEFIREHRSRENDERMLKLLDDSVKRLEYFSFRSLDISILRTQGTKALNFIPSDLNILINNNMQQLKELAESKNVKFEITAKLKEIRIPCDVRYINKVIFIVLDNAVRHSDKNAPVQIEALDSSRTIKLLISNKGKPFPESMLDQTFPSFVTGKKHVNTNIGIDLHYVKLAMTAHNGNLFIENNKAKGALVTLEFRKEQVDN
jgi:two-component system sensor histidine kinase/response regulator